MCNKEADDAGDFQSEEQGAGAGFGAVRPWDFPPWDFLGIWDLEIGIFCFGMHPSEADFTCE